MMQMISGLRSKYGNSIVTLKIMKILEDRKKLLDDFF